MYNSKVKVVICVRPVEADKPLSPSSTATPTFNLYPRTNQIIMSKLSAKKPFVFDHVFDEHAPTTEIFSKLGSEMLSSVMEGYNYCNFFYGQKGSGKSQVMYDNTDESKKGFIPIFCEEMFKQICLESENQKSGHDANENLSEIIWKIKISYLEVFNEQVFDLNSPAPEKNALKVREHTDHGVYVESLTQVAVKSSEDIQDLVKEGQKRITNPSRSHTILTISLTKFSMELNEKCSKISFIDLAPLQTVETGKAIKEDNGSVNKSLSALGAVISKLAENNPKSFITYRESILTRLLKDNLEGKSRTVFIATVSPAPEHYEQTLSTLRYAERAKKITHNPTTSLKDKWQLIRDLKNERKRLLKRLPKREESENSTEELSKETEDCLQSGTFLEPQGIHVEKDGFYLLNLNPSPNELLIYPLNTDKTVVGCPNDSCSPDIQLSSEGIESNHCVFTIEPDGNLYLIPYPDGYTSVNKELLDKGRKLHHGDNVTFGTHSAFRVHLPVKKRFTSLPIVVQYPVGLYRRTEE